MLQRWQEIAFLHWSCDPDLLRSRLPRQLQADTFEGKAWVSLTPFLLTGMRPPLFPHRLGFAFPEMNLRTYVSGPNGPGIWFFSLDASQLLAVVGARASLNLKKMSGAPWEWNFRVMTLSSIIPWVWIRESAGRAAFNPLAAGLLLPRAADLWEQPAA